MSDVETPGLSPVKACQSIGMVAGEASGDLLGSMLIKALQQAGHQLDCYGIAGPKMQACGARSLYPMETLSVRGYVEALANIRRILAIRRSLKKRLLADRPRLFIGMDAPDFNLALEADLKKAGVPTVHFISPSIWAWRRGRINMIRRAVSHMLLVFPFEEAIYRDAGIPATYVGHPLAHALPERPNRSLARERLDLRQDATYVALLPGSRQSEVDQLASLYLQAAKQLTEARPEIRFLVPMATRETRLKFELAIHEADAMDLPIRIIYGHAHDVLQAADAAIIASGTATLEAALLNCPHIITYKVPWLTAQIMKRQAYLPWVGLPNILAGRQIVPELLQEKATPAALAGAVSDLLANKDEREAMTTAFASIRTSLRRDTPTLIAGALAPFIA